MAFGEVWQMAPGNEKIQSDSDPTDPAQPERDLFLNETYALGPRISSWDSDRKIWLENNPEFPNLVSRNRPRVLLLSGSPPNPCDNAIGDHYLLKAIKNKITGSRSFTIWLIWIGNWPKSWIALNTGSFLLRNCQWTLDPLDTSAASIAHLLVHQIQLPWAPLPSPPLFPSTKPSLNKQHQHHRITARN
ncbi:hypothetical protein MLD38_024985 [Melastoma candidum]|uniref:Uncharacterized protein n=1 Tax=Melastoma candidum TaxID=119954 RepID=A0ACB9NUX7_9MYRT|nr:hypothetical protein MLD38_024985 [Melastoma candidum]